MGNTTLLTPKLAEEIADLIRKGNYLETAAAFVGIGRRTLFDWLKRGAESNEINDPDGLYRNFADVMEQARAEAQIHAVAELRKGEGQWQRWAWWLERSFPKWWGRIEYRGEAEGAESERDLAEQAKRKIIETLDRMSKRTEALENEA